MHCLFWSKTIPVSHNQLHTQQEATMNAFQHIDETQADIAKAAVDEAKAASDSSSSATSDADASYLENSSETAIDDMAAERQPQQQNQQQQQEERAPVFDVRSVNTRGSILRLM